MVWGTLFLCELFMLGTGLIALITGRFPYRPGRPVTGITAYIGGALMMAPMAIGLPVASMTEQANSLADGIGKGIIIRAAFIVICFCIAYLQAAILFDPVASASKGKWLKEVQNRKKRRRKKGSEDEGEDETPRRGKRRRRREEEDLDDDDAPRRRRREEDEDDDEPPRRRRASMEEDDDLDRPAPPPLRNRDADEEDLDDEPSRRRRRSPDDDDLSRAHRPGPPPMPRG